MKKITDSLDPRVQQLDLQRSEQQPINPQSKGNWPTYEVFHQAKSGKHHVHAGSVHAPDPEMALLFAKEQFGRRQNCVNMWVVKTTDVFSFNYEDSDMFLTTPEKIHREAAGYKVRDKIQKYKNRNKAVEPG